MTASSPTSITTTSDSYPPSASEPHHKCSRDEPSDPLLPVHGVDESPSATLTSFSLSSAHRGIVREGVLQEIPRLVVRQKLQKCRHLVLPQTIRPEYLDSLFPQLVQQFEPQVVQYNGGIANVTQWKISCYLEVMKGGIPCTNPHLPLLELFRPLLDVCNDLFLAWYRQQHACNNGHHTEKTIPQRTCQRLMTFITRYTPAPGEQALLKVRTCVGFGLALSVVSVLGGLGWVGIIVDRHLFPLACEDETTCFRIAFTNLSWVQLLCPHCDISLSPSSWVVLWLKNEQHIDGAGRVAGSIVVSLPIDRWSGSEEENSFVGHGGGLTFWDGRQPSSSPSQDDTTRKRQPRETHYDTRSGDVAFIDRYVI